MLTLTFAAAVPAQEYSFRLYGASEGLQNLVILSLAQDRAGYVWAGTEGGLYRYEGARFRLIGAAEGLRAPPKPTACSSRRMVRFGPISVAGSSASTVSAFTRFQA